MEWNSKGTTEKAQNKSARHRKKQYYNLDSEQTEESSSVTTHWDRSTRRSKYMQTECYNYTQGKKIRKFGFNDLKQISQMDAQDIIFILTTNSGKYQDLLEKKLNSDWIICIMRILAEVCGADFDESVSDILINACRTTFINQVEVCVAAWSVEETEDKERNFAEFLNDTITFCKTVIEHYPTKIHAVLKDIYYISTVAMKQNFQNNFHDDYQQAGNSWKNTGRRRRRRHNKKGNYKPELPPNDFREIQIFPTYEEILEEKSAFVRPNVVRGSYEDVQHYLDVHFRLLREDFIQPLRAGIQAFTENGFQSETEDRNTSTVKIFKGVKFLHPRALYFRVAYTVAFDPTRKTKDVQWETTKRLISGSLVVFTCDNFNSILLGTVVERNLIDIYKGIIIVELHDAFDLKVLNSDFIMVETTVHFESYRHVLVELQKIDSNNFPMERYIIKMQHDILPPKYLLQKSSPVYKIHDFNVRVLDIPSWPSAEKLEIDDSQCKALQSALTKEFVVIQGPPGTGKTFLALKVTEALLANVSEFPILVICYTNHALDQFLEGLLRYTKNLIRVGGQSQCVALEDYNLQQKRKEFRDSNRLMNARGRKAYSKLPKHVENLKDTQMNLKAIEGNHGIVSLRMLHKYGVISDRHYDFFTGCNITVADWLYNEDEYMSRVKKGNRFYEDELPSLYFDKTFDSLAKEIYTLERQLAQSKKKSHLNEKQRELNALRQKMEYFRRKLFDNTDVDKNPVATHVDRDLQEWNISYPEKWELYRYWVSLLKKKLVDELNNLQSNYKPKWKNYNDQQQREDINIMKSCEIIGMTTTRAARDQQLLQEIKPKIVIVEEAAEVLESHIVASLTQHCEHLILIGDHKQLRPSPAVYELATRFHLDISLFERMVKNGMDCNQLQFQHRMRPDIASLIVPAIYPSLKNHPDVLKYEDVIGIAKNLYFVTHTFPEEDVPNSTSYRNTHEAEFLIALCKHLLLQGYSPSQITILATYSGQVSYYKELKKDDATLQQVCMTTVDNYQGEQNDIILLSLVRSNKRGIVGFLKTQNRVCVALSRAKKGLYIIGNMDILRKGKSIWNKIYNTLEGEEAIGSNLPLKCQNHPSVLTHVASAEDFKVKSPKGSCMMACNMKLQCGHKCKWICHLTNREHENYTCRESCKRTCKHNHVCKKQCCDVCGPCMFQVRTILSCKHYQTIACSLSSKTNPATLVCQESCNTPLPCGHSCDRPCHIISDPLLHYIHQCNKPCMRKRAGCKGNHLCTKSCWEDCERCLIRVKKILPCRHTCITYCSSNSDEIRCSEKCNKVLPCGHPCPGRCGVKCGTCTANITKRIPDCNHLVELKCSEIPSKERCRTKCEKVLPCGHKCITYCSQNSDGIRCSEKCNKVLPCGHPCPGRCGVKCGTCTVNVTKRIPGCNHLVELKCSETPSKERCRTKCEKVLPCGHKCITYCSQNSDGILCFEISSRILACGHKSITYCSQNFADIYCSEKVPKRIFGCNHTEYLECGEIPIRECCRRRCERVYACGHKCCGEHLCKDCFRDCVKPVLRVLPCGHKDIMPCCISPEIWDCTESHSSCTVL